MRSIDGFVKKEPENKPFVAGAEKYLASVQDSYLYDDDFDEPESPQLAYQRGAADAERSYAWLWWIILLPLVFGGKSLVGKKDYWQGVYEQTDISLVGASPRLNTIEECYRWVDFDKKSSPTHYNYECGKNCKMPETLDGPYRCDD